jgi:hypothetical protein
MANWLTDLFYKATTGKTATEIERQWDADNETLAGLNQDLYNRGLLSEDALATSTAQLASDHPETSVANDFWTGAAEGLSAEQNAVKTVLGTALWQTIKFVPWWAWVAGALVLAAELGMFKKILPHA